MSVMNSEEGEHLYLLDNKVLDFKKMEYREKDAFTDRFVECSYTDAVKKLQMTQFKLKVPIGVIGSGQPDAIQYDMAVNLGRCLADIGLTIICGGRAGIMEAVCKGASENNGVSIGVLPESSLENVNQYVSIPIASGIGFARNALISSSSFCLVAVGGGNGTLCEIAYGLKFKKKIFTLKSTLVVAETIKCKTVEEVIDNICKLIVQVTFMKRSI